MVDNWRTDLPEPKKNVILCLEFPNPDYSKVTVGYYSPNDRNYGANCFRDILDNEYVFDDSFEPRHIPVENVIGWQPFPEHMRK